MTHHDLNGRTYLHFTKKSKLPLKHLCFTLFLFGLQPAHANSIGQHGSISVQTVYDSSNTRDAFLDLSVGLNQHTTIFAGIGNSNASESTTGANDELDLDYWNAGINYQFNNSFTIGLNIGESGQDNDINTRNIDIDLIWDSNNWSFRLTPQFRELDLLFTPFLAPARIIDITSKGIGTTVTYKGIDKWEMGVSFDAYDYDRDVRTLSLAFVIQRISSKALTVASGLSDYGFNIEISRLYSESDISASYGQNKSAIDGEISNIARLNMNFYQLDPMAIGVEVGAVGSDVDTASYYGGLTLGYAW